MKNKYLKIPLVKKNKKRLFRLSKLILLMAFFGLVSGLIIDSNTIMLIAGFVFIVTVLYIRFSKQFYIIGLAIFSFEKIEIEISGGKEIFNLIDLDSVKIKYQGYRGESEANPVSIIPKDGTGNFILFTMNRKKYSYELLLDKNNLNILNSIITQWMRQGNNVTLIGEWGLKVKSI